ncbi:MAG TPA: DUF362 domain-containing protein [Methanomicrobia archaeon]|nr:DUF362 domain-containing protein [Methanomicrobia archaeon]
MNNQVFVVRCPDYEQVEDRMADLLAMMGGMREFVAAGEKIVLKPNLLLPAEPQKAVTTHPAVVAAVAQRVNREGAYPVIADSSGPGYPYTARVLGWFYRACGLERIANTTGFELNYDTQYRAVSYLQGTLIKRFEVITPVLDAAGLVNLCKLKTHAFMHMTGAVKNLFGVVPGLTKPGYHAKLNDKTRFAAMLLDLAEYIAPRLSIMDAVVGLEGDGPGTRGRPRHVGLLIGARNPLALDVVASEIIGLERTHNPVVMEAERRGLVPTRLAEVELIGAQKTDLRVPGYKLPATVAEGMGLGRWDVFRPLLRSGATLKPRVIKENCTACGACRDSCPAGAITITSDHARIDDDTCIRCYCCHELCPESAITLHHRLLYRMVAK